MPRLARLDAPGVLHHVMGRGIEKRKISSIGIWTNVPLILLRQDFSRVAVKLLGYAGAEAGRYLGVTSSCVTRVASQEERLEGLQIRYGIS